MFTKRSYATYAEVPWYRRNWFVWGSFLFVLLWPVLVIVLVTGDVYYKKDNQVLQYSSAAKAMILIMMTLMLGYVVLVGDPGQG